MYNKYDECKVAYGKIHYSMRYSNAQYDETKKNVIESRIKWSSVERTKIK